MKSHVIADVAGEPPGRDYFDRVERLAAAGADFIQVRGKHLGGAALYRVVVRCRELIERTRTRLLVNSRVDVALAAGADGVHLPADGLPVPAIRSLSAGLLAGRSCHSFEECRLAIEEGADYLILGPVFDVRSKPSPAQVSFEDLRSAATLGVELYALGGISSENLGSLAALPIAGVAAITLFMVDDHAEEIVAKIREMGSIPSAGEALC
ncbi:MAG TPA: thiamine phosphate synthase [Thermoanaerobaculia bacterium]|nr:thiamine phosphate synthase [Thermoanaerobaculia bacterium]